VVFTDSLERRTEFLVFFLLLFFILDFQTSRKGDDVNFAEPESIMPGKAVAVAAGSSPNDEAASGKALGVDFLDMASMMASIIMAEGRRPSLSRI
jgi:hypothetical protein